MFSFFLKLTLEFSLFASLGYIDGADSTISSCQWKTIAFIEANKNNKFIQSADIQKSKLLFGDGIKEEEGISMISDFSFTNLIQGSDNDKKPMLIG